MSFASDYLPHEEKELSQHMQVSLKIAGNIKDLAAQASVKDFFFSRFRRQIIKKNLIDKIHRKVDKYIDESEMLIRSKEYKILFGTYVIQRSKWFHLLSFLAIFANSVVLGLSSYPIDKNLDNKLEKANLLFFIYFVIELIIKLVG